MGMDAEKSWESLVSVALSVALWMTVLLDAILDLTLASYKS